MNVDIPKGTFQTPGPCWIPVQNSEGKQLKPRIKCECGRICYIGLHHVHADGTVTASFFDSKESSFVHNGKTYHHQPGCGWHVFLKLLDYDLGDFPPEED
jgi:hypothetical protein